MPYLVLAMVYWADLADIAAAVRKVKGEVSMQDMVSLWTTAAMARAAMIVTGAMKYQFSAQP